MNKIIYIILLIIIFSLSYSNASIFKKKQAPVLFLTSYDPRIVKNYDEKIEPVNVFNVGERIYFSVYNQKGFKSNYIKYQIVKQEDNAHIGGYTRIMNKTVRVENENYYIDYIVINQKGKYFIQIFDLEDLNHWIVMGAFAVFDR